MGRMVDMLAVGAVEVMVVGAVEVWVAVATGTSGRDELWHHSLPTTWKGTLYITSHTAST